MRRALAGIRSILKFNRWLLFIALPITAIAAAYPVFYRAPADSSAAGEKIIEERKINYRELMAELQARAEKFPGEAAIVIKDIQTQQEIGINVARLFPSASLVKVPIMAAVYQAQEEGKLRLEDHIILKKKHKVRDCSRLYNMRPGRKVVIRDIIERMITESDNTATNMLVDALGFGYLNQKFIEFGLKQTDLRRGVMDLKWRKAGIENYTTAADMALLLEKIYNGELVSHAASAEMLEVLKRQKVNDRIPRLLPDGLVIAHKTGLLNDTVSDVGIVFTKEGDFIICVLTADIKSFLSAKKFIGSVAACAYDRCYRKPAATVKM